MAVSRTSLVLPMHITLRQYVRSFCLAFCALPFAGFGKFVQYCPGTWRFIQMVHEKRSLSVLSFSVLYSSLMALLVLTTVLCNLYTMHWRLRRHPRSCLRDQAQAGSGPRQESQHPLEELEPPVAGSEDSALRFMVSAFNCELLGTKVWKTERLRLGPVGSWEWDGCCSPAGMGWGWGS
ncbi:hypothetical protein NN561_011103 [Cricetulus griseus]